MKRGVLTLAILILVTVVIFVGQGVLSRTESFTELSNQIQQQPESQKPDDVITQIEALGQPKSSIGLFGVPGFVIGQVLPDSPAEKAGLRRGDIVTAIDGQQVNSITDVLRIGQQEPGKEIRVAFLRYNPTTADHDKYSVVMKTAQWVTSTSPNLGFGNKQ